MSCICDWPSNCGGTRHMRCLGCGGDFCVCAACGGQGQEECWGCKACEDMDGYEGLDEDWVESETTEKAVFEKPEET